jgi:phospholipid/cholesterol/gamma-HCH transport system ATP-binding protein
MPPNTPNIILSVENICKSFGEHAVLVNFNLNVHQGENLVVLGKSGSGKSVLIKCIIGLLTPDSGRIVVFDKDTQTLNDAAWDTLRARVGFLFQSNALYDSMTVRENLEFPLRRHWIRLTQEEVEARVIQSLNDVGLAHTIDLMPDSLSGGMRKRIALARTLIMRPAIILYDEPTTGLDPITGREIINLMNSIREKYGTTSLIISHDMNCIKRTSDQIAVLSEGRCHALARYNDLIQSADPVVSAFFNA